MRPFPCDAPVVADSTHAATDLTRRQLFVGTAATAVAFWAGCRDDEGGGDDAAAGTTTTHAAARAGWRSVRPRRGLRRSSIRLRDPLDPARSRSARARRARRHARHRRRRRLGGRHRRRVRRHRGPRRRRRRARATPTPCTSTSSGLDPGHRPTTTASRRRSRSARWHGPAPFPTGSPDALRARRRELPVVRARAATPPTATWSTRTRGRPRGAPRRLHLRVPGRRVGERATLPDHAARDRSRTTASATRRTGMDEHLRAAHARFPFVLTWDDHEVANNYSGDGLTERPGDTAALESRQTAAYRGVVGAPPGPCRAARRPRRWRCTSTSTSATSPASTCSTSGSTATCRPCRDGDPRPTTSATARSAPTSARLLGEEQEAWFARGERREPGDVEPDRATRSCSAGVDGGNAADGAAYYLDTWDGYPTARHRFIDQLAAHRQPGRAHRRLPRRDAPRRPRAAVRGRTAPSWPRS